MPYEEIYPNHSSKEFYVYNNQEDVHVDITVEKRRNTVIWGYVHTPTNLPVNGAYVELYKYMPDHYHKWQKIRHTRTNPEGYYHFLLPPGSAGKYLIEADVPGERNDHYHPHPGYNHHDHHDHHYDYGYNRESYHYNYEYDYNSHSPYYRPHNYHEEAQYFEEEQHTGTNRCGYSKKYKKNNIYYH